MPPEQDSPLEALNKRIYGAPEEKVSVPAYTPETPATPYGWQAPAPVAPPKKHMPWTIKFLIGTGAFLVIAGAAAALIIFFGARAVSNNNVQISVPPSIGIASGDTVSLVVNIHNGNPAVLTDASFNADLPEGTRNESGAAFTQYNDVLGPVPAGADVTRTIQVKLFGEAGQTLTIPMKVQYHIAGSNALYQTKFDYTVTISSSPISVQVQTLSQSPSGQAFTLTVLVRSNASAPVEDVALLASYPSGFSVQSATPSGTSFFNLGTIAPGEQKTVQIKGTLTGQDANQRVFRFTAGSVNPDGTNTLGNTYAQGLANVAITHPFLNVSISLNNDSNEPVIVRPGGTVNALLNWRNTLPTTLANASIRVAFSGNALAPNSIDGGTGFYRSADSSVIFDSSTNQGLGSLPAGNSGVGSFGFSVKQAEALAGVQNPTVLMTVSISGLQSAQGGAAQSLTSTLTRTVKVGTVVNLTSSLAHTTGGVNGPVPPKPSVETLYSITLTAKNTINSVGAAKETFILPSYVRYTGQADPGITYNPDTRTVTWMIGDLSSGASGVGHFQLGFTPSDSQHGTNPVLVNEQSFTGFDRFTQQQVTAVGEAITTELPGASGSGLVQ